MRLSALCSGLLLVSTAVIVSAQTKIIDFNKDKVGQPPSGFSFALTGKGKPGVWVIKKDESSPDHHNVLAQTDPDPTGYRFPVCVYGGLAAKDADITVRFRPISGKGDHGAGIVWPEKERPSLEFHVSNIGAGHSMPTGSNRRAVYLKADAVDFKGRTVASREWMFAPWYANRPDDRAFLEEDKKRPDAVAAGQADAQGSHEAPIRAGEERILYWAPKLRTVNYHIRARLIYDLNRYNDRAFLSDQTETYRTSLSVTVRGR